MWIESGPQGLTKDEGGNQEPYAIMTLIKGQSPWKTLVIYKTFPLLKMFCVYVLQVDIMMFSIKIDRLLGMNNGQ